VIQRSIVETTRPAYSQVDLNTGKPDASQATHTALFTAGALAVSSIGGGLVFLCLPSWGFSDNLLSYVFITVGLSWRIIPVIFGSLLVFFGVRYAWAMGNLTIEAWDLYQSRQDEWHRVTIASFKAMQGVETIREYSSLEIKPDMAKDVLLMGLFMQYQISKGTSGRSVPYSVSSLGTKHTLNNAHHTIVIGELTGINPEKMSRLFAELGWVQGRRKNVAGNWVPTSYEDVFTKFIERWPKLSNKPVYINPNEEA
jgi:hypothetical protein